MQAEAALSEKTAVRIWDLESKGPLSGPHVGQHEGGSGGAENLCDWGEGWPIPRPQLGGDG